MFISIVISLNVKVEIKLYMSMAARKVSMICVLVAFSSSHCDTIHNDSRLFTLEIIAS